MKIKTKQNYQNKEEKIEAKDYWAKQNSQPDLFFSNTHYIKAISEIATILDLSNIFEFGCAAGRNLNFIKQKFARLNKTANLSGIDINERAVKTGKKEFQLDISVADEDSLQKIKSNSFDLVFTVSVLDHVPEPSKIIDSLMKLTREFGLFLEPSLEKGQGEFGKAISAEYEWIKSKNKLPFPFTYYHDYESIFKSIGCEVCFKLPLPTHLSRSGPLYKLWFVRKKSSKTIIPSNLQEVISKSILINLLNSINDMKFQTKQLTDLAEAKNKKLQDEFQYQTKLFTRELHNIRKSKRWRFGSIFVIKSKKNIMLEVLKIPFKIIKFFLRERNNKLSFKTYDIFQKKLENAKLFAKGIKGLNKNFVEKKFCYILHNSLPNSSGGYAIRSHNVAKTFKHYGFEVICVTRPGYPLDEKNSNITDIDDHKLEGLIYSRIPTPTINGGILKYLENSIDVWVEYFSKTKPSFIIAASSYRSALPALIAAKTLKLPFIYEVRGFWEITRASREKLYHNSEDFLMQQKMETLTALHSDHVIALNNGLKKELVKRGIDSKNISLFPNSADISNSEYLQKNNELLKELNIPNDVCVIGYVGSFVFYEGLEDLTKACGQLYKKGLKFRLLIVGNEFVSNNKKGPISEAIIKIAKEYGFMDWLIMPGRVKANLVSDYYSIIDIAPFPRKSYLVTEMVSPMKLYEAMNMKKAVIVSSVDALKEMVVENETALIFEKDNISSLSEMIEKMINNKNLREEIAKNGKKFVMSKMNWNESIKDSLKQISKIVNVKL
jgi:glycosyltransferase involved in cell wall biosynthesis/SAM-dependent methyltransferase